ncbi:MAG: NAD(P)H-hydrate dehydratase [Eubacterium sp.]|nr:NAD(P)H-hydrate dehydratase [Eubacterium sp.]
MIRLLTARESKEADRLTISRGMPSPVLMERAALSVLHTMQHRGMPLDRVLVIAGSGNNGGDGIAVARMLCEKGFTPSVLLTGNPDKYSDGMRHQMELLSWYHPVFVNSYEAGRYTVVVDAIFGVGLSREITGPVRDVIDAVNADPSVRVIAVDIPSGIHADNGSVCGTAIRAERTVTFAYGKPGLYLAPGTEYAGEVRTAAIGIPEPEAGGTSGFSGRYLLESSDLQRLPARDPYGNKGTYGKLLVIAGSREICGAAYLAGRAALVSGAGMVRILTEQATRIPLAASFPEALISTYAAEECDPAAYQSLLNWADGVLVGPGIGTGKDAKSLLAWVLCTFDGPLVLDADALNLIAADSALKDLLIRAAGSTPGRMILTPHLVEMSRLTGLSVSEIRADLFETAEQYARTTGAVCVLKDAKTVIAHPAGVSYLMASGTSALATAGSGDVLAGIITALHTAASGGGEICAAALGDLVHGLAGRRAEETYSARAVTAADVIGQLHCFL